MQKLPLLDYIRKEKKFIQLSTLKLLSFQMVINKKNLSNQLLTMIGLNNNVCHICHYFKNMASDMINTRHVFQFLKTF